MNDPGAKLEIDGMRQVSRGLGQIKSMYCGFKYYNESMFYSPSCAITEPTLKTFRIFAALYHWTILLLRSREVERLPLFCYLTNIVYLCCASYYTIAAYNSIIAKSSLCGNDKPDLPVFRMDKVCYEGVNTKVKFHFIAQWLLHSVICNLALLVSILYFVLIYNPETDVLGLTNISRHLLNSVFILVELTFNSITIKFTHLIWTVAFAASYIFYTVIFWCVVPPPENYIYTVVDWNRPGKTIRLIFIFISASVIIELLLLVLWRLKLRLQAISKLQHNPFLV